VFCPSVPTYIYIAIHAAVFLMKGTGFDKLLDRYLKDRLKAEERQRAENLPDHLKLAFFSLRALNLANRQFSFTLNWEGRGKVDRALCQPPCRTSLPACLSHRHPLPLQPMSQPQPYQFPGKV